MKWRKPGQPYEIEVAGVTLTCKPMTRGEALTLGEKSMTMPNEEGGVERLYAIVTEQIVSIDGFEETPAEVMDAQGHEVMIEVFKAIIGASALSSAEVGNLKASSDGPKLEPPVRDADTPGGPTVAGTPPKAES